MSISSNYYHASLRKAISIFGSRFNDIQIMREVSSGTEHETVDVPLQYAPIQKFIARIEADASGGRASNIIYPRMSFEITNIQRDSIRKIQKTNRIDNNYFVPVPYNIDFQLNIGSKNAEDSIKIVEQILPLFNPNLAISAQLLDNNDEIFSTPLELNNVVMNDTYDGDFMTRRAIIWQLDFTLRYYFFGPIPDSAVIKFVKTNIYSDEEMTILDQEMTGQPGLTANSEPTTDINDTIAYTSINADDNYGFIFQVDETPEANN